MARKNEQGRGKPVHCFSCEDCKLLVIEYPRVLSVRCPLCNVLLDEYVTYDVLAVSRGIGLDVQTAQVN
jgi:hypothetical protein